MAEVTTWPTYESFPCVPHAKLGSQCPGKFCCETKGEYVILRCDGCGETLGAIERRLMAAVCSRL